MATRIHNFSYSGGTGLLQFVPCIGNEKACKVYIKTLRFNINTSLAARIERTVTLSTKAADSTTSLMKAYWTGFFKGNSDIPTTSVTLAGGCAAYVADWKLAVQYVAGGYSVDTNLEALENEGAGWWPIISRVIWSGKGYEQWLGVGWIRHEIPEYFYMKPNETLTFEGYTGIFHIELMAISET